MKQIILPGSNYNPGDSSPVRKEELIPDVRFVVHKFTNRPRPDRSRVVIIPAFSEFGCESLIPLYCLPNLLQQKYQGRYSIVMGWYGRQYLYQHLVDEYWELGEEHQHLREFCRAFHHTSKNLARVEKRAAEQGHVVPNGELSNHCVYPRVLECVANRKKIVCKGRVSQFRDFQQCQKCGVTYPAEGIFNNCVAAKRRATWIPLPSAEKMKIARDNLPTNAVGVTARGRKCYGRNLTPEFYERLIWLLEDMGYNPVWLGEKSTTLPCPCPRVFDFSRHEGARDLEQTLAYVANMNFTIQFWTASSRLAGFVGTPFIIFESPDQIWGRGQEGYRLYLTSKGPIKLALAHFRNVVENNTKALRVVETAVRDLQGNDFSTLYGMVESESAVRVLRNGKQREISWF